MRSISFFDIDPQKVQFWGSSITSNPNWHFSNINNSKTKQMPKMPFGWLITNNILFNIYFFHKNWEGGHLRFWGLNKTNGKKGVKKDVIFKIDKTAKNYMEIPYQNCFYKFPMLMNKKVLALQTFEYKPLSWNLFV